MKILEVVLNTEKDAVDFVSEMTRCSEDIDLSYGHFVVDAKSILGVLGLGVGKKVRLSVYSDDTKVLEENIKRYIVSWIALNSIG